MTLVSGKSAATRQHVTLRLDPRLLARIDARAGTRTEFIERACVAFLAHDEGCAVELARVVRRFLAAGGVEGPLDTDARAALARFGERSRL